MNAPMAVRHTPTAAASPNIAPRRRFGAAVSFGVGDIARCAAANGGRSNGEGARSPPSSAGWTDAFGGASSKRVSAAATAFTSGAENASRFSRLDATIAATLALICSAGKSSPATPPCPGLEANSGRPNRRVTTSLMAPSSPGKCPSMERTLRRLIRCRALFAMASPVGPIIWTLLNTTRLRAQGRGVGFRTRRQKKRPDALSGL